MNKTIFAKKSDINIWDTIKVWDITGYKIQTKKEYFLETNFRTVRIKKNVFESLNIELKEDKWDVRFYKVIK